MIRDDVTGGKAKRESKMRKELKKTICMVLVLLMALSLCSCGSTSEKENSGKLDLDYEEGSQQSSNSQSSSSGSWFSEAFSFGKKDEQSDSNTSQTAIQEMYSGDSQEGSSQSQGNQSGNQNSQGASGTGSSVGSGNQASGNSSAVPSVSSGGNSSGQGSSQTGNVSDTFQGGGNQPGNSQSTGTSTGTGNNDNQGGSSSGTSGKTVTITIRCDTAVNNGMHLESKWAGIVPASGVILPVTTVEIEDGQTVFDVLAAVCSKYKIHMSYRGGMGSGCYVDGINNLYEFDGGRWSGWMYCVNKWYPNYGCGVYYVKAGDIIEWNYTCDLGLDLEGGDVLGGSDWKETHP